MIRTKLVAEAVAAAMAEEKRKQRDQRQPPLAARAEAPRGERNEEGQLSIAARLSLEQGDRLDMLTGAMSSPGRSATIRKLIDVAFEIVLEAESERGLDSAFARKFMQRLSSAERYFIRRHVNHGPYAVPVKFKSGKETDKFVDHLALGMYYGGNNTKIGDGRNKTSSFALDVDLSDTERQIILKLTAGQPQDKLKEIRDKRKQERNTPEWRAAETKRLDEMSAEAKRIFPKIKIFRKPKREVSCACKFKRPI